MLALLFDKGIDVVHQLFSLIIQRDLDCLQKLEPSDDASLLPKSFFEDLILMLLEEQPVLSQSLYYMSFLPFRNVGWRSIQWFLDHTWQGIDRWCGCWGLIFVCWAGGEFLWWVCWLGGWAILQKGTSLLLVSYNNSETNHWFRIFIKVCWKYRVYSIVNGFIFISVKFSLLDPLWWILYMEINELWKKFGKKIKSIIYLRGRIKCSQSVDR